MKEETGIILERIYELDWSYTLPVDPKWRSYYAPNVNKVTEQLFIAEARSTSKPSLSFEHNEYRWVGYTEKLEQPDNIIPAIQRAKKAVDSGQPALVEITTRQELAFSLYQ